MTNVITPPIYRPIFPITRTRCRLATMLRFRPRHFAISGGGL